MVERGKTAGFILLIAILCSSGAGGEAVRLQFRPEIGRKQTMRMTSRLVTTYTRPSSGPDVTTHAWTVTAELEPRSIAADGSVTLKVAMLRAQYESSPSNYFGLGLNQDSDREKNRLEKSEGALVAFLGASFTIVASARGGLLDLDTRDFYRAIVRNRMEHEDRSIYHEAQKRGARRYKDKDEQTRQRLIQADAQIAIREMNEGYGSRVKREQAYKDRAPESWHYGRAALRLLFSNLLASFGPEPVQPGGQWTGPVMIRLEEPMELAGTYTLKGIENGVCTIQVEATRSPDDKPIRGKAAPESNGIKLTGAYQATIKVDQATGSVLSREAVMELKGTATMPFTRTGNPGNTVPVTTVATTIVEVLPSLPDSEETPSTPLPADHELVPDPNLP